MPENGTLTHTAMERVIFGEDCATAIASEVERLGAERVFLIVSRTLNCDTPVIEQARSALGPRFAGLYDTVPAHVPRPNVIAAAQAARDVDADLLVTIGGGSVTDAAKIVQICLQQNVTDAAELDDYRIIVNKDGSRHVPTYDGPEVRQITVPTTLSGGEFNPLGGCTDPIRQVKEGYRHHLLVPRTVILDPAATVHTPQWLWLSTGIRALDHAVEGLCSPKANPFTDGMCLQALRLLSAGLPACRKDPENLDARQNCLLGVMMAMMPVVYGVPMGASHAIGHILGGTCNVPHGYTSCIMLPSVLRYNAEVTAERQMLIAEAMGRPNTDAADVVAGFIADLNLPRQLSDVDVSSDKFALIANNCMHDHWLHTNPRKIPDVNAIIEILEMSA